MPASPRAPGAGSGRGPAPSAPASAAPSAAPPAPPPSPALDELLPLVYEELRTLARRQRRGWEGDFTLNTTALVHEAWLKLDRSRGGPIESRSHLLGLAGRAMRQILCDYARDRKRLKRGGDAVHLPLDILEGVHGLLQVSDANLAVMQALDEALTRLEAREPRQARVVECRFFAGLGIEDTARALGISPPTVKRDWAMARAWLFRELHPSADTPAAGAPRPTP
jgi:RNA polymerase sigma factor (TIGR02999 family)